MFGKIVEMVDSNEVLSYITLSYAGEMYRVYIPKWLAVNEEFLTSLKAAKYEGWLIVPIFKSVRVADGTYRTVLKTFVKVDSLKFI